MNNQCGLVWAAGVHILGVAACASSATVIESNRELFVDDHLIASMDGVELRLHRPVDRDVAITFDKPWEGNISAYVTVLADEDRFRMYYRGSHFDHQSRKVAHEHVCCAESVDGIRWTRPELGQVEFDGSKSNNIMIVDSTSHNFTPFKDTNPDCRPEATYKAVTAHMNVGMFAHYSSDGIHWHNTSDKPIITQGAFDSQNLVFYDNVRKRYVAFLRDFRDGVRDIKTATSEDFIHWTEPKWLDFGDAPAEHLYTSAVVPCPRAPHIFIGFPKRFRPDRKVSWHPVDGVSDGVFMTSRDGVHWHRWLEAFLIPGPQKQRWVNRNNLISWGVLTTKRDQPDCPDELSIYSTEGYYQDQVRLRRHTLRMDGFVSVHAAYPAGEIITKPLVFSGDRLNINHATSAAGSIRIEIQDEQGRPIPGYALDEAVELWGDDIDATVSWKTGCDLSALAGKPVRLRAIMQDADFYSFRFAPAGNR